MPDVSTTVVTVLHRNTAHRRGLCIDCQQVKPAAAMPRCWPCHREFSGMHLTPKLQRQAVIRAMSGSRPTPAVFVLATFIADTVTMASAVITT